MAATAAAQALASGAKRKKGEGGRGRGSLGKGGKGRVYPRIFDEFGQEITGEEDTDVREGAEALSLVHGRCLALAQAGMSLLYTCTHTYIHTYIHTYVSTGR